MHSVISLESAKQMQIGQLADLSVEQLFFLQFQVNEHLSKSKLQKDWIDKAISLKYQEQSCHVRNINDKVTGTIHFNDGEFKITSNISKKIEWNQEKLKEVVCAIKEFGDNPYEYVDISYKVPESKYNSWPEHIKKFFRPARLLKTSKESFKIESTAKEVSYE